MWFAEVNILQNRTYICVQIYICVQMKKCAPLPLYCTILFLWKMIKLNSCDCEQKQFKMCISLLTIYHRGVNH